MAGPRHRRGGGRVVTFSVFCKKNFARLRKAGRFSKKEDLADSKCCMETGLITYIRCL